MSLRQRTSQTTPARTTSEASEEPSSSNSPKSVISNVPVGSKRKGIRINRVLGRIVPIILLVYISYTYDLVVVHYSYGYLYLQQRRTILPILWLVLAHGLFLYSLRAYLRVFFAHSHSSTSGRGLFSWLRAKLGATFPDPERARQLEQRRIRHSLSSLLPSGSDVEADIELCDPEGSPLRCYRSSCAGRLKCFRMRHCGDCGTCRVGFDHHCAWFDNDVASPSTLPSFIAFLLSVPPLYLLAVGPLFPTAWRIARRIMGFASTDPGVRSMWYNNKYSWFGGPVFRYGVGFVLGAMRWSNVDQHKKPHETTRAPLVVAFGALFIFIACVLANSSLSSLGYGKLTIDIERSKAYSKLSAERRRSEMESGENAGELGEINAKMAGLAPVQWFKVIVRHKQSGQTEEKLVSLSVNEGLLSHGSDWTNMRHFLRAPASRPAWLLSDQALRKVVQKAGVATRS